jgi:hypothetical protein
MTIGIIWINHHAVRSAGRAAGSDVRRHPRSGVLRTACTAALVEAAVAPPRVAVSGADGCLRTCRRAGAGWPRGVEACRQVGEHARPVSQLADELGVGWWTIMNAVTEHGTPLVDDAERIGRVRRFGVDETSFLAATPQQATVYATGMIDLERHVVIDMVEGNSAADLRRWTTNADPDWVAGSRWCPLSWPSRSAPGCRRIWITPGASLTRSTSCASPTAASIKSAAGCRTRRSGHRGRQHDPLYRMRKLLLTGSGQLDDRGSDRMLLGLRAGDPRDELLGAWLGKESVRDVYLADTQPTRRRCSTRRSSAAPPTTSPRSARSARRSIRGVPRSSPTTTPAPPTDPPKASTCASRRSSDAATASDPSSTTGYACYFTPAASHRPNGRGPHASEPALPTQTRQDSLTVVKAQVCCSEFTLPCWRRGAPGPRGVRPAARPAMLLLVVSA